MSKFIKLTGVNGETVYVKKSGVLIVVSGGTYKDHSKTDSTSIIGATGVFCTGIVTVVTESAETVLGLLENAI
jgi:hypothetical protein